MAFQIDYNHILIFHELAKFGNASEVANMLNTNVSKISRDIKLLEKSLNTILFYRRKRGFELTPEGQALLQKSKIFLEVHTDIAQHFLGEVAPIEPRSLDLNIITSRDYIGEIVAEWIQLFLRENSDINLKLYMTDIDINESNFYGDINISHHRIFSPAFGESKLFDLEWRFVAAADSFKQREMPKSVEDLYEHDLIGFSHGSQIYQHMIDLFFEELGLQPRHMINHFETSLSFIKNGFGVGFMPGHYAEMHSDQLIVLKDLPQKSMPVFLTFKRSAAQKIQVERFIYFIQAVICKNKINLI